MSKGESFSFPFHLYAADICISKITGWFPWRRVPVRDAHPVFERAIGVNEDDRMQEEG